MHGSAGRRRGPSKRLAKASERVGFAEGPSSETARASVGARAGPGWEAAARQATGALGNAPEVTSPRERPHRVSGVPAPVPTLVARMSWPIAAPSDDASLSIRARTPLPVPAPKPFRHDRAPGGVLGFSGRRHPSCFKRGFREHRERRRGAQRRRRSERRERRGGPGGGGGDGRNFHRRLRRGQVRGCQRRGWECWPGWRSRPGWRG
jgi:hypothetical protein